MKVGILTYHYGYNEGTLLQAHATQRILTAALPDCQVEIIDWRYPPKERLVFGEPCNKRQLAIRRFFDDALALSSECFRTESRKPVYAHLQESFDLVVIGSDELWRTNYTPGGRPWRRRRQTCPWSPPFPNVYWPRQGSIGVPCVSMASSISENDDLSAISLSHRREMGRVLEELSLVSVRDSRTAAFVDKLTDGRCQSVWLPDPTFALDSPSDDQKAEFAALLRRHTADAPERVALLCSHSSGEALRIAIQECKAVGMTVAAVTHSHELADIDLSDEPLCPFAWRAAPYSADVVITDRFHGAVFAIKANTPVIAIDYRSQTSGEDSKMLDLLRRFGAEDHWYVAQNASDLPREQMQRQALGLDWPTILIDEKLAEFKSALHDFAHGPIRSKIQGVDYEASPASPR